MKRKAQKGEMVGYEWPVWEPLEDAVGDVGDGRAAA